VLALAHIERGALARRLHELLQYRHDQPVERRAALADLAQPHDLGTELVAAALQPHQEMRVLQRAGKPQDRALVELRALGELGQRQRRVVELEGAEHGERPFHRCHRRPVRHSSPLPTAEQPFLLTE
jgi:hypothetical protein